jgi:alpha-tubulin suppressor-like RCC1 family protein
MKRIRIAVLRPLRAAAVLLLAAAAACRGDSTGSRTPAAVAVLSGSGQPGTVGQPLASPVSVRVTDAGGRPVRGVAVQWAASGGGSLSPASSVTDASGTATAQWTLGGTAGPQSATAAAEGVAQPATFTATAAPGAAARLVIRADSVAFWTTDREIVVEADVADAAGNVVQSNPAGAAWSTRDPAVATAQPRSVYARIRGRTELIVSFNGLADTVPVVVRQVPAYVVVDVGEPVLRVGETRRVFAFDTAGKPIQRLEWASTDPAVVTVEPILPTHQGLVTARAPGQAAVVAVADGTAGLTFQVRQPAASLSVRNVSAGGGHTCAAATEAAWCWGDGSAGQLGTGGAATTDVPARVVGAPFDTVAAGSDHSCGLRGTQAYCWGAPGYALGNGSDLGSRGSPVAVAGGHAFATISAGTSYTCGVTAAGQGLCWGINLYGQIGFDAGNATVPGAVQGGLRWRDITTGRFHTCGVTVDDRAWCWGDNGRVSRLGLGPGSFSQRAPAPVAGGLAFRSVTVGEEHGCALTPAGQAYCWGANDRGQLGNNTTAASSAVPVAVAGGLTFARMDAGRYHTCGVTTAGQAWCWGDNAEGQLGNADADTHERAPVLVAGGITWTAVSGGGIETATSQTCGVAADGRAYCWGSNTHGQLGRRGGWSSTPVLVAGPDS